MGIRNTHELVHLDGVVPCRRCGRFAGECIVRDGGILNGDLTIFFVVLRPAQCQRAVYLGRVLTTPKSNLNMV